MKIFLFVFLFQLNLVQAAPLCFGFFQPKVAHAYEAEITIVIGTDRLGSNSSVIAAELTSMLKAFENVKVNVVDLSKLPASIFKSDYFAKKTKAFTKDFVDPIARSSGLIFVIPEYDGAVPGILSYYMNHVRLSLEKKHVSLVGLSAGRWGARSALDAFKGTLSHRGARILGDLQINIENVDQQLIDGKIKTEGLRKRILTAATEFTRVVNQLPENEPAQKTVALFAGAYQEKIVSMRLNNGVTLEGKLGPALLNPNGTLAYVKFNGGTKIKHRGEVIPGQDVDIHAAGYSMPVGAIQGFKSGWTKKDHFEALGFKVGQQKKLSYQSGLILTGKIKKMIFDQDGNLLVLTFENCVVKFGDEILYPKAWGDFDLAVADFVETISLR